MKQWKAGDLVWVDEKGFPTSTGGSFSGVIVYTPPFIGEGEGKQAKELQVAYSGVAPVRVEGGIPVNGMVMGTPGDHIGRKTGSVAIGRMMHGEATPTTSTGEVLAMVQLGGGGGESEQDCPFGEIITEGEATKIRGGLISGGKKTGIGLAGYTIDLSIPGEWLVSVQVTGIKANTDDDKEIILPGLEDITGTPTWQKKEIIEGEQTNYDDNTNFTTPTSEGTAVIPIGRLVITEGAEKEGGGREDGVATLYPIACGNIAITQCAGILSHTRS